MSTPVPFREALAAWAHVGLASFGGPAGQIATMHRVLVEEKRWLSEARFMHALSFCMLLPGPEAMQLATYSGWLLHGRRGALAAGLLFVLPGLVVMLALAAAYVTLGHLPATAGLLFGLKAAVVAVVLEALLRMARRALTTRWLVAIAAVAFVALSAFRVPFPAVVAAAALAGWLAHRVLGAGVTALEAPARYDAEAQAPHPSGPSQLATVLGCLAAWLLPIAALAVAFGRSSTFVEIGLFFSKAAVVTFGGAYSVLAYVAQQAVDVHGWLRPAEMVDGLGLAETTPGPLVLVLVFVGVLAGTRHAEGLAPLAGGLLGGLVAAWATFAPSFLFILAGAPHVERLRSQRALSAALQGVTAAVVGVVLNLTMWFSVHSLFGEVRRVAAGPLQLDVPVPSSLDPVGLALAVAAAVALLRFRVPMLAVLAASAVVGLVLRLILD